MKCVCWKSPSVRGNPHESISNHILVGGLEHEFYVSIYWKCQHPNWHTYNIYIYTQYFFQRGRLKPPTRSSKSSYLDGWILQDDSQQVPMLGQVVVFGAGGPHLLMLPWWFSMATMAENVKSPTSQKCRWTANTRQAPKSRRFRQFLSTIILHSLGVSHWTPTLKGPILGGMTCLAFRM